MREKLKKFKAIEYIGAAVEGVKTFIASFVSGFCVMSGLIVTMLMITAKRTDSHLVWEKNSK